MSPSNEQALSYPRQRAVTRGFRLGVPRSFVVSDERLVFARSASGRSPLNDLWVLPNGHTEPFIAVDAGKLIVGDEALPSAERARRERLRESSGGITAFATNTNATLAAFALSGSAYVVELTKQSEPKLLSSPGPVVDPRLNQSGTTVAYVVDGALYVVDVATNSLNRLTPSEPDTVSWGLADFIAAEELDRMRGFWWLDDNHLLVQRTDEEPVQTWYIANPATPDAEPIEQRYPAAGTANANVSLWVIDLAGDLTEVVWAHEEFEYLASVSVRTGVATFSCLNRAQDSLAMYATTNTGAVTELGTVVNESWVDVFPGVPTMAANGDLITIEPDASDTNRLHRNRKPVTPEGLQIFGVQDVLDDCVIVLGSSDPLEQHAYRIGDDGTCTQLTSFAGLNSVRASENTELLVTSRPSYTWDGVAITSFAEDPVVRAAPEFHILEDLHVAVLFPSDHVMGSGRLPVVMAPYGGPHHQRVLRAPNAFSSDQWLANQGFAVIVADGHGTGGRGPAWDRSIAGDFATLPLDDQVRALNAVAQMYPDDIDASRVGIHGWSFGGYLAALAVLDRPDVFRVAVAGAPVTDWLLYDTGYTERYLGLPEEFPDAYRASSLIHRAPTLERPLMLIHGIADDNVVFAHTLSLSSALLAAGRVHTVLPLTGVTHMTPQEEVAENLLLLQLDFLTSQLKK